MAWVPIQESSQQFNFSVLAEFGGAASLESSVAIKDQGTPPSGSTIAEWVVHFQNDVGRPDVRLRVTALSFAAEGPTTLLLVGGYDGVNVTNPTSTIEEINNEAGDPLTEWSPTPFEVTLVFTGGDDLGLFSSAGESSASTSQFLIEVWEDDPAPPEPCEEIGRASRAYVSAYDRSRVHVGRFRRQERRCVIANFNASLPKNRTIARVTWRCTSPWVTKMSTPSIVGRDAQVIVDFQNPGFGAIKATITLDNGEVYNQTYQFQVRDEPWFLEDYALASGPYQISIEAQP
jgi:hypothetical protein